MDKKNKETELCDKGVKYCFYEFCPEDSPTKFNNLEVRFGYSAIVWFLMLWKPPKDIGIFTLILLFYIPLLIDYLKFNNQSTARKYVRKAEIYICFAWIIFCLFGYIGIMYPESDKAGQLLFRISRDLGILKNISFSFVLIWKMIGFSVMLTLLDKFVFENKIEKQVIKSFDSNFNA